jgi:hypothetical protein
MHIVMTWEDILINVIRFIIYIIQVITITFIASAAASPCKTTRHTFLVISF